MHQQKIQQLQTVLGYSFNNLDLLTTALTHRSYLNESQQSTESNERMEYLGDAVLELVTSEFLYHKFPNIPEGKLTSLRSKIVQTKTLAAIANTLQLGSFLLLSKGEQASGGAENNSLLADLMEATIGAIFLDGGIEAAKTFITTNILSDYQNLIKLAKVEDWKSKLQELVQAKGGQAPTYEVIKQDGPDHDRIFTVTVTYFNTVQAKGTGKSKQRAHQAAAKTAFQQFSQSV